MKVLSYEQMLCCSQVTPLATQERERPDSGELNWIQFLVDTGKIDILIRIAGNPTTNPDALDALARNGLPAVREAVAENHNTQFATLLILARDPDAIVRLKLAANQNLPSAILLLLADDRKEFISWKAKTSLKHSHWRNKLRTAMHE